LDSQFTDEVNDNLSFSVCGLGDCGLGLNDDGERLLEQNKNRSREGQNATTVSDGVVEPTNIKLIGRNIVGADLNGNCKVGKGGCGGSVFVGDTDGKTVNTDFFVVCLVGINRNKIGRSCGNGNGGSVKSVSGGVNFGLRVLISHNESPVYLLFVRLAI